MTYRLEDRSSTPLIHAARVLPARSAAPVYRSRRSLDSRSSYRSVSPLSRGGRPLGRLAGSFMGSLYARTNMLTSPFLPDLMSVH